MQQAYPDISNIFIAKSQRRVALAALSWEEKVAIVEQMRAALPKGMWRPTPPLDQAAPQVADLSKDDRQSS